MIKRKSQKIYFIIFLLFFLLENNFVFAQGKPLEAPLPGGPSTTQAFFPDYVKFIFQFILGIAGIIALGALISGGIRYLTSAGNPTKLSDAQGQILAAFWGLLILLASFMILKTINPELVKLSFVREPPLPLDPGQEPPGTTKRPDILAKIKEVAEAVETNALALEERASELNIQVGHCSCTLTEPLCVCRCSGSQQNCRAEQESCQAQICYSKNNRQPCPEGPEIKTNQQRILAFRYELLYYKNKALAEKEDLLLEKSKIREYIDNFLTPTISAEQHAGLKQELQDRKTKLEQEESLKNSLAQKLQELADLIYNLSGPAANQIAPPALEIAQLPDQCELPATGQGNIFITQPYQYGLSKCTPACKSGGQYSGPCHDKLLGCQPDKCTGPNPCPVTEIQARLSLINNTKSNIATVCQAIRGLVEQIIQLKTVTI